jgi:hypothetical protein
MLKVFALVCYLASGECQMVVHEKEYYDLDVCMRAAIALQIELTEKLSKVKPAKVVGGCQQWKKPDVQTKEAPPKRGLL